MEGTDEAAVQEAALAYLRQRGFETAAAALASRPIDVKLNDILTRERTEAGRDAGRPRCFALHIEPKVGPGYEEGYVRLGAWIRQRTLEEQRELSLLCFPMYVHCFLSLAIRTSAGGEAAAPERFLRAHMSEHDSGGNSEKRKQVEQLLRLISDEQTRQDVGASPIARIYLTQRVTWVCSASAFEAVTHFLVEARLHLLLRILILYFNVHAIRRSAAAATAPPPAPAAGGDPGGADAEVKAEVKVETKAEAKASGAKVGGSLAGGSAPAAAGASKARHGVDAYWGELQPSVPPKPTSAAEDAATPAAPRPSSVTAGGGGAGEKREKRPCIASVCVLRVGSGGESSDISCMEVELPSCAAPRSQHSVPSCSQRASGPPRSPRRGTCACRQVSSCMHLAACGRSDGALILCRFSRDRVLESRFRAPLASTPPLSAVR